MLKILEKGTHEYRRTAAASAFKTVRSHRRNSPIASDFLARTRSATHLAPNERRGSCRGLTWETGERLREKKREKGNANPRKRRISPGQPEATHGSTWDAASRTRFRFAFVMPRIRNESRARIPILNIHTRIGIESRFSAFALESASSLERLAAN